MHDLFRSMLGITLWCFSTAQKNAAGNGAPGRRQGLTALGQAHTIAAVRICRYMNADNQVRIGGKGRCLIDLTAAGVGRSLPSSKVPIRNNT